MTIHEQHSADYFCGNNPTSDLDRVTATQEIVQSQTQELDYFCGNNPSPEAPAPMLEDFFTRLADEMKTVGSTLKRDLTMKGRLERRFLGREVGDLLGVTDNYIQRILTEEPENNPAFPRGEPGARGSVYSLSDVMLMRAILESRVSAKYKYLYWREPGDPLPVVTFGAQKGGTGKSLTAAHFAQYLTMQYGLRVGIIDCDPQATVSLYFADQNSPMLTGEAQTVAAFMGVENYKAPNLERPVEEMHAMWTNTPWPGAKLMPAGAQIQNGDLTLLMLAEDVDISTHSVLQKAIKRWDDAYGPRTTAADLRNEDGSFNLERYHAAMDETVDVIIIDQQPSLTLMQLNGLVAATNVVIPQTMKGFDLSTLGSYANAVAQYLKRNAREDEVIGAGKHIVLPTIIQGVNEQDTDQVADLYYDREGMISQVFYSRSEAVSNAAEYYKSIYEYVPETRGKRPSAKAFTDNANAVNDHLVDLVWNGKLPSKGFADTFIQQKWS